MDGPGSAQTCKKIKKLLEDKIYKKNKKINNNNKKKNSLFIVHNSFIVSQIFTPCSFNIRNNLNTILKIEGLTSLFFYII